MKHVKKITMGGTVPPEAECSPVSAQKAPLSLIDIANSMIAIGSFLVGIDLLKAAP